MRFAAMLVAAAFAAPAAFVHGAEPVACERPGARYAGPMIDAMAQIEWGMTRRVADAFERGGITRMALFARLHRKRNGEADVLALAKRQPGRFMFATDAHKDFRWARYAEIVEDWRRILGQLPPALAESLAWRNAERVYGTQK